MAKYNYNIDKDSGLSGFYNTVLNYAKDKSITGAPLKKTQNLNIENPFQNNYRYNLEGNVIPTGLESWWSKNIAGKSVGDMYNNYSNWVKGNPIGATVSKWAPAVAGGIQGIQAISNLSNNSNLASQNEDLTADILASYNSNPLASTYLTADQMSAIRKLKRGYDEVGAFDGVLEGIGSGLGDTLGAAALGLATGNPIAALVNAGGALINSGIQGHQNALNNKMSDLESLYSTLQMAQNDYNSERRQNYNNRIRQGGIL